MNLLPATNPLAFVAIGIMAELIRTKRGNRFIFVIKYLFTKLTRTIPLKHITAADVAHAFVNNWVFVYYPPQKVLSWNGIQFMACFLT